MPKRLTCNSTSSLVLARSPLLSLPPFLLSPTHLVRRLLDVFLKLYGKRTAVAWPLLVILFFLLPIFLHGAFL